MPLSNEHRQALQLQDSCPDAQPKDKMQGVSLGSTPTATGEN